MRERERERKACQAKCSACPSGTYQGSGETLHSLKPVNFIFEHRGYEATHA